MGESEQRVLDTQFPLLYSWAFRCDLFHELGLGLGLLGNAFSKGGWSSMNHISLLVNS